MECMHIGVVGVYCILYAYFRGCLVNITHMEAVYMVVKTWAFYSYVLCTPFRTDSA
jgi:hypothetical protein